MVNIGDKKTEKAIKAILDAFDLDYNIAHADPAKRVPTESEEVIYDRLKKSAKEIKLYKEGKIKLQNAAEFSKEL